MIGSIVGRRSTNTDIYSSVANDDIEFIKGNIPKGEMRQAFMNLSEGISITAVSA
jgi:hypothetical protein